MKPIFAVVASGAIASGILDVTKVNALRGVFVPGITSADMLVQGGYATASGTTPPNSGDFARMLEMRSVGSGDLKFATGPGSRYIAWPLGETLPPYLKLEFSAAQADTRTLTLLTR